MNLTDAVGEYFYKFTDEQFPMEHVCTTLKHGCNNWIYGKASGRIYKCCYWCTDRCKDGCHNDPRICNVHAMMCARQPQSNGINGTQMKVAQIDKDTHEVIQVFQSAQKAAQTLNVCATSLRKACKEHTEYKGWLFELVKNEEETE